LVSFFSMIWTPLRSTLFPYTTSSDLNDLRESLRQVIGGFLEKPVGERRFWNINFPAMQDLRADTEIIECGLDPSPLPVEYHVDRSEEHTSELQSRENLVCRLLLEKKK